MGREAGQDGGRLETYGSAFNTPGASRSAATYCHGGRRASKHEDSRALGGAATAVQAMHGDSCSATRVDPDPMCSTNFGNDCTGPPAPPCSGENALVDNGDASPKLCLPLLEMRSPTAAGGLLPTGEASIAKRTTYNQSPLRLYAIEDADSKTNLRTRILYVSYDSSFLPATSSCRRVIETKLGENRMFDPGGSRSSSTPARFWDRGAHCFVGRFMLGLDEAATFF